tara:strand:- start:1053 stop:1847 length:795 start_codon:yes stop_codon:yes gene_type:complete
MENRVKSVEPLMLAVMLAWAIPSQAAQECVEGVTTRSWSPERTVKAHELATRKGRDSLSCKVICRSADKEPHDNKLKNITGLGAAVPDAPSTGTYGGINRATWTFWRSTKYSGVTDGGSAVSASNIQQYMDSIAVQLIRGTDKPDLIVADNNYYRLYLQSLQSIQRISDSGSSSAGAGFASLKYYGAGMASDVVLDGGIGSAATANHMWFLNTKYMMFRPHADRNFVPIGGERQAINQDAVVKLVGWAGNLTSSGPQFCGVLIA